MAQPSLKSSSFISANPSPLSTFLFVVILCILGYNTLHDYPGSPSPNPRDALSVRKNFLSSATNYTVASYLRALTRHPHVAGTEPSLETVRYVESHFREVGLDTHTVEYEALLSYPEEASLSAQLFDGTSVKLSLMEPIQGVVQPYHAYSPSGSVVAEAVFVNYGRDEDYRALGEIGVNVSERIVIARRGEQPRGAVVQMAEANGAAAVLLYVDGDSFRNAFERGTVMRGVGDPLTPGWAGIDGAERLTLEDTQVLQRFPKIPSMPVSAETAEIVLRSLGGSPVPAEWRDSKFDRAGPGPTVLNFTYKGERKVATIHNVFAVIKGIEEPDRFVLLGNHRDAWTYGAVDPNSGTAALLDLARRFALLGRLGWTPRRTILLCSWDAEEFGMIGSTEWVEQNVVNLGSKAVAYLNVDCAVQGPGFFTGATPQLDDLLLEVTSQVQDPDSEGSTVYETWTTTNSGIDIGRLSGVDSDFTAFVHHAGVPSIDVYYGKDFPVYHTAYDSYDWMTSYGDPLFHRHVTVANIWGLLALELADDPVLPFNYLSYANELQAYAVALSNCLNGTTSLHPLTTAIQELTSAAKEALEEAKKLREEKMVSNHLVLLQRRALNDRLMLAERGFLDVDGLQGRPWFKHLIYGPPTDYGSKVVNFPGISQAISQSMMASPEDGRAAVQHEIWRAARAIQRAASALRGELT